MGDPANAVFSSWSIPIGPSFGLLLSLIFYLRGWLRLQFQVPNRFPIWRLLAFTAGLATIFVAIASPLDAFAGLLLQIHMIQHLLLMMIAPPLILAGAPYLPLLSGFPRGFTRDVLGPFLVWKPIKRIGQTLVHPLFAGTAFAASNLLWHIPPLYELALRSPGWHQIEHFSFIFTGLLFWWPLVQPWPSRSVWPRWTMIPYLIVADLQNTALAGFLSFYDRVLYPAYERVPRLWGSTPLEDQGLAGTIMWVPGSIMFLVPAAIIAIRFLSPGLGIRPSEAGRIGSPEKQEVHILRVLRRMRIQPGRAAGPFDLFGIPLIGPILKSKFFRRALRSAMLLLAIAIAADGFLGPQASPMNLAGVLPWTHWRGVTVIALLTVGNFFCMACPFTFVRDIGRRLLPAGWPWPRPLRTKWLAAFLVALYLWAYEAFSLWNSPWLTAWIIVGYFLAAFLIDGFFRGAAFCKYVCPIGQFHFVQSLVSPFEVKIRSADVCRSCKTFDCIRGRNAQRGCELELFQPKKKSNFDCTFCLDCVHACPHDNVGLLAVTPGKDLWNGEQRSSLGRFANRLDIAALVLILSFGALANAAGMIAPVAALVYQAQIVFGLPRPVVLALFLLVGMFLGPGLLVCGTGILSRKLGKISVPLGPLISDFAMTLVPLGFGMWIAHLVFHLFTGSHTPIPVFQRVAQDLHLPVFGKPDWAIASWALPQLLDFEIIVLGAALLGSLYATWKIAKRYGTKTGRSLLVFAPWSLLDLLFFLVAIWIIFQPMDMRGTMIS
jgi:cytochrome c oxidase assembly factor CtaG